MTMTRMETIWGLCYPKYLWVKSSLCKGNPAERHAAFVAI